MSEIQLTPIDKDPDVISSYEKIIFKPSPIDILDQQVSVNEAFDTVKTQNNPFGDQSKRTQNTYDIESRWNKCKNYCFAAFQTRASDFFKTDKETVGFSKRVRDRLAELAVTSDEEQMITSMQQNEEKLREEIKKQSDKLEHLYQESKHWEMIELISKTCSLLQTNSKSPQFYPAQFMLVLELVEHFGKIVYERISSHEAAPKDNFLAAKTGTREFLCLNWSMILCRTSTLLPRLLLQIAFLKCCKFHPFKTVEESINQIINAIPGLGSGTSGIYVRAYFVYKVFTLYKETSCEIFLPLLTSYVKLLFHLKESGFKRQFQIIDYSFSKYLETHKPALEFFISVMVSVGDANFLKSALEEFYSAGVPSSFILSVFLNELPPKFVSKFYQVLLLLIDKSDDIVPHPELIYQLLLTLTKSTTNDDIIGLMNNFWNRMSKFTNVEDFMHVASPMTKFIANFCSPHYLNLFLKNVVSLLRKTVASRSKKEDVESLGANKISKTLAKNVSDCIITSVSSGKNFTEVLSHVGSVVDLMDFLDEDLLVEISRFILTDVSSKQIELNDPLCIRILLELSQILFQSLSILSPLDVIEKTNQIIEWFIYHIDFGSNIEAHLNFLLSARSAFSTSDRLLSVISKVAIRLTTSVYSKKMKQYDVITRSLLSFVFVTISSISNDIQRTKLNLLGANASLICNIVCNAHSFYDEFEKGLDLISPSPELLDLYFQGLNFLILMPSNPDEEDPFGSIHSLIVNAVQREWPDDEPVRFALVSLIMMSHSLRSEYTLRITDVDSNDILFAGESDFKQNGKKFINQMIKMFLKAIQRYGEKGVIAQKTKVPIIALNALSSLPDVYEFDQSLLSVLKSLVKFSEQGDNKQIKDLRSSAIQHLKRIFMNNEDAKKFLKVFESS